MPAAAQRLDMNGYRVTELSVPAAADDAIRRDWVESRGTGLITNGSGLMGSNYNFGQFTFDQTETHGGMGSFKANVAQQGYLSAELIPIDPEKAWRLVGWAKAGDTGGGNFNAANKQYFGIQQLDIDGQINTYANNAKFAGSTDTTLAVALNPSDTTITLTDATGWNNGSVAASRHIAWWPYTNGKGYTWPDYTYTRNVSANNTWAQGGITGNVITLVTPWAGPALPAGTKVRNAADGGNAGYKYIAAANVTVPNAWTRYEGYLMGVNATGTPTTTQFEVGTNYLKLVFLINYHGAADNNIRWSDMTLTDLSMRNLENDQTIPQDLTVVRNATIGGTATIRGTTTWVPASQTYPQMSVFQPTAANGGYLQWHKTTGVRKAYLGYGSDATIDYVVENGAYHNVNQLATTGVTAELRAALFSQGGHTFAANLALQRAYYFNTPTAYVGDIAGRTITDAATVYIAGAPTAGTNMTITRAYSLWVAGAVRLDNALNFSTDVQLYRAVQASIAGLELQAPFRVPRVGLSTQWIGLVPGDVGGVGYLDGRTTEANKKYVYFRSLHDSSGSPAGNQGFIWQVGPLSSPLTVGVLSSAGQLQLPSTGGSASGLLLGGDANLYRSAADTLKTDDALDVGGLVTLNSGLKIPGGAGVGLVLGSDANGLGSWVSPPGGPPSGTAGGDLTGNYPNPSIVVGQTHLDAVAHRGYGFRMISGEAAVAPGSFIRAAQQNNNTYNDEDYFQGWLAGNTTGIKQMKAGVVKIFVEMYLSAGVTQASISEAGIFLNGSQYAGTRLAAPTTSGLTLCVGPIIRNANANDLWQFGPVSNGNAYQGTDGRYTHGWIEYLGPP